MRVKREHRTEITVLTDVVCCLFLFGWIILSFVGADTAAGYGAEVVHDTAPTERDVPRVHWILSFAGTV